MADKYVQCHYCRDAVCLADDYVECICGLVWCSVRCARHDGYTSKKRNSSCNSCRKDDNNDHGLFMKEFNYDCHPNGSRTTGCES